MKKKRSLASCIQEFWPATILTPIFVIGEVAFDVLIPLMTGKLLDEGVKAGSMHHIAAYGLTVVGMAVLALICGGLSGRFGAKASTGFARNLRREMYRNVQKFSFANIDKFSTSGIITRLTTDVTNVQMAFMMVIRIAVRSPIMLICAWVLTLRINPKLALIFLVVIPILGIGLFAVIHKVGPLFKRVFRKYDALNNSIQENVKGMRVVKSFVREAYEKEKFHHAAEEVCQDFTRAEKILAINSPLMQFCLYVVMIFVLSFGSYTIITSGGLDLDVGQFSALLVYSFQILNSLMMFSMVFVMVTMAAESAQRIVEVLKEDSTLTSPADPVEEVADGSIDFDHVSFKYSLQAEKMALADIDLHIRSGETIGIIGGTGSSKSSLIQLISRLYDATEGVVKVGGKDVREYDLEALRNQVAVVLQKNILFSGTIKENLRWGNQNATDEELKEACCLAQADEFIMQFPDQFF